MCVLFVGSVRLLLDDAVSAYLGMSGSCWSLPIDWGVNRVQVLFLFITVTVLSFELSVPAESWRVNPIVSRFSAVSNGVLVADLLTDAVVE